MELGKFQNAAVCVQPGTVMDTLCNGSVDGYCLQWVGSLLLGLSTVCVYSQGQEVHMCCATAVRMMQS